MEKISLEEAVEIVKANCQINIEKEEVNILDALGRVVAEDIIAEHHQPPFPRSPLDGYALRGEDTVGASSKKVKLKIIDEVCAGHISKQTIHKGECIRIMTGAPMPEGSNAVVRQEDTEVDNQEAIFHKEVKPYQNYCYAGEDYEKGEILVSKGEIIKSAHIGLLASNGKVKVAVKQRLKIGVMSTGDELIEPGTSLLPGKIYNSNLYTLTARLKELGCEPVLMGTIQDDIKEGTSLIQKYVEQVDMVITTGGVSVGKKDIMHPILKELEVTPLFWRLKLKPGTPVLAGKYKDTLLLCLSGNPSAAAVTFELLFRPLLGEKYCQSLNIKKTTGIMMEEYPKNSKVRRFIKARTDGKKVFLTQGNHSSGALRAMNGCNCFIDLAPKEKINAGEQVEIMLI